MQIGPRQLILFLLFKRATATLCVNNRDRDKTMRMENTTFGSFLTFYYVLHHIFHANLRISENRQFFEVLTFSLFLRIELFDLEKSLNFQIFKKVFGTMLEYINTDTTKAEYDCFAFENQRT